MALTLALTVWSMVIALCLGQDLQVPLGFRPLPKILDWVDCGDINNHTLECSEINVPMDHFSKASDKEFSIPLIRLLGRHASETGDRHILLNPGGPGGSGIDFLKSKGEYLSQIVGEDFHLLSFDPRAVGKSRPQGECFLSNEERAEWFSTKPWNLEYQAGEMYTRAENMARACEEMMGEQGKYINTPQTAADMNLILDAIGQEEMYFWGFSYGTTLGQTYAQMYPDRVRRLIIDGVSNLEEWYSWAAFEESYVDTDRVWTGFFEECIKAGEACPFRSTEGKPFTSATEVQNSFNEFLDELDEQPIPVYNNASDYGSISRRSIVSNGIFPALYKPTLWPELARNLNELLHGNHTPAYKAYSGNWLLSLTRDDSGMIVENNDHVKTGKNAPFHGIHDIRNHSRSLPEPSYIWSRYIASEAYDRASWRNPTTHHFRPQYYPDDPPFKTSHPILVLSTSWDPVCPLTSATKAYRSFEGAGLLEQKSYGHCSISMPSLCTAKHVRRYFTEGTLPKPGTTCDIDGEYFPDENPSPSSARTEEDHDLLYSLRHLASLGLAAHTSTYL